MASQEFRHPYEREPDVELVLEGDALERVHGDVLSKYSPLMKMILAEQAEMSDKQIDLSDFHKNSVRYVLNYMYYGEASIDGRSDLIELLALASFLQMRELHAQLVPMLDTENFIDSDPTRTINIAFYRDCKVSADMKNVLVRKFIVALRHMSEEKKRQLAPATVMSLVAFDMPIEEKTIIVNLALDWLRFSNNSLHSIDVVECVRIPMQNDTDLMECISKAVEEGGIARDMLRLRVNEKREVVVVTEPSTAPEIDPESVPLREADLESKCPVGGQYTQCQINLFDCHGFRVFSRNKCSSPLKKMDSSRDAPLSCLKAPGTTANKKSTRVSFIEKVPKQSESNGKKTSTGTGSAVALIGLSDDGTETTITVDTERVDVHNPKFYNVHKRMINGGALLHSLLPPYVYFKIMGLNVLIDALDLSRSIVHVYLTRCNGRGFLKNKFGWAASGEWQAEGGVLREIQPEVSHGSDCCRSLHPKAIHRQKLLFGGDNGLDTVAAGESGLIARLHFLQLDDTSLEQAFEGLQVSEAGEQHTSEMHTIQLPGGRAKEQSSDRVPVEDEELMEELKSKDLSFYKNMKNLPDSLCKKYMPDLRRRWQATERRVKDIETMLALPHEDRTLEQDRFEILGELLDKAAQGLDIWDKHHDRNIMYGHRVELETRLLRLINAKFDIICKIANEFDKLKGDKDGTDHEREFLRYEIRDCDMKFAEIHDSFLKSSLDMEW